jgi:hypothetical protein
VSALIPVEVNPFIALGVIAAICALVKVGSTSVCSPTTCAAESVLICLVVKAPIWVKLIIANCEVFKPGIATGAKDIICEALKDEIMFVCNELI